MKSGERYFWLQQDMTVAGTTKLTIGLGLPVVILQHKEHSFGSINLIIMALSVVVVVPQK